MQTILDRAAAPKRSAPKKNARLIAAKINLYGEHRCHVSAITWHELISAQVRRDLGKKGIGLADAFIAGQPIAGGFTLVSNNTRHFARVQGLHLVNWAI